ncbi:MAG: heavy-metal-associated domain-containing protein [Nitrospinales bacterium]
MTNTKSVFWIAVLAAFLLQAAPPVFAQDGKEVITVKVKGMFCPFCTYGVEKKLKRLKGVARVEVHLKQGVAKLYLRPGATLSDAAVNRAVDDAGFTPGPITRSATKGGK